MGPLILTNLLIIFDALHQKEDYCLLPNNKEKKSILPSSKIKTLTNTQEVPPSVCQVMFFSAMGDAHMLPPCIESFLVCSYNTWEIKQLSP